jgi:hypothetical protein
MRWQCEECGSHAPTPGTCPLCGRGTLVQIAGESMDPDAARRRGLLNVRKETEGPADRPDLPTWRPPDSN